MDYHPKLEKHCYNNKKQLTKHHCLEAGKSSGNRIEENTNTLDLATLATLTGRSSGTNIDSIDVMNWEEIKEDDITNLNLDRSSDHVNHINYPNLQDFR